MAVHLTGSQPSVSHLMTQCGNYYTVIHSLLCFIALQADKNSADIFNNPFHYCSARYTNPTVYTTLRLNLKTQNKVIESKIVIIHGLLFSYFCYYC